MKSRASVCGWNRFNKTLASVASVVGCAPMLCAAAEIAIPEFRAVTIDSKIEIGYGVTVADVDGDGKPDILLADKKQIVWYRNPGWEKFVIAENLTKQDNVCLAAADINGDGKAELAVGAEWNPNDTVNSGAVFYLEPPSDRTQRWKPIELAHEPTVHRMRWAKDKSGHYELVVTPLHGRGNKNGAGDGVRILSYRMPANPEAEWKTEVINDGFHMTHNFEPVRWDGLPRPEWLLACKEGVYHLVQQAGQWKALPIAGNNPGETGFTGAGEVRAGKLPGGDRFFATVEPMHGNQVVVYTQPDKSKPEGLWKRHVLDTTLKEGHALACGDLLGAGSDQFVVGWRQKNDEGKVGIKLFVPLDASGEHWKQSLVDDNAMACEDLCLADLDGDGRLDIIASGRATKNVKIYFNQRPK